MPNELSGILSFIYFSLLFFIGGKEGWKLKWWKVKWIEFQFIALLVHKLWGQLCDTCICRDGKPLGSARTFQPDQKVAACMGCLKLKWFNFLKFSWLSNLQVQIAHQPQLGFKRVKYDWVEWNSIVYLL